MTSAAITERGSIMNLAAVNVPAKTDISDTGFTQVMDKAVNAKKSADAPGGTAAARDGRFSGEKISDGKENSVNSGDEDRRTEEVRRQDKPDAAGDSGQTVRKDAAAADDEISEAGEEAAALEAGRVFSEQAEELVETVAESLSVETEKVMQAMQELGMGLTDILDPGRMTELIMAVTGEDRMSLVTDEALYGILQDLTAAVRESGENLMNELSVSAEEFRAMLDKLGAAQKTEEGIVTEPSDEQSGILVGAADEKPSEAMNTGIEILTADKQNDGQKPQDSSTMTQNAAQEQGAQNGPRAEIRSETADLQREDKGTGQELAQEGNPSFAQQIMNRTNEFVEALTQEADSPYAHVDAEQIMKQVTDFIKLQVSSAGSEVELQLHPAHLGTLNIAVAAKNGIITAQFTAQDEAVRAVLESQVAELKSRLEEQGVKVEAVEVTIASHEFERSLEQNADQDANERGEAEAKRRTTRRLNLDEPGDGDAQGLDDGERIARDMMRIHGNRLDYLA